MRWIKYKKDDIQVVLPAGDPEVVATVVEQVDVAAMLHININPSSISQGITAHNPEFLAFETQSFSSLFLG